MTRNPRDHREWTNKELERDPEGYLAAQSARRKDQDAQEQKRRGADDLERFTEAFVAAGGSRADATAAFKAHRNEQATTAARAADQSAAEASRRRVRSMA
jgi:hypothetical protein